MKSAMNKFLADESGATAIEYGLIAALLSVVIIASLQVISTQLKSNYTKIGTAVTIK